LTQIFKKISQEKNKNHQVSKFATIFLLSFSVKETPNTLIYQSLIPLFFYFSSSTVASVPPYKMNTTIGIDGNGTVGNSDASTVGGVEQQKSVTTVGDGRASTVGGVA